MEENFHHFGTAIVKFWIHIDQDEQLRRFQARQENPQKQWKLHEEDWQNREMETYEEAVEEMFLARTQGMPRGQLSKVTVSVLPGLGHWM